MIYKRKEIFNFPGLPAAGNLIRICQHICTYDDDGYGHGIGTERFHQGGTDRFLVYFIIVILSSLMLYSLSNIHQVMGLVGDVGIVIVFSSLNALTY